MSHSRGANPGFWARALSPPPPPPPPMQGKDTKKTVLRNRNDLFRNQLGTFRVPDPTHSMEIISKKLQFNQCHFLFHTKVRIRNINAGTRKKFRIKPDPY